jgi:hypothetical protein
LIPGDFQISKPTRKQLIKHGTLGVITLGFLVVAALALTFVISAWLGRPVIFGYSEGPDQPIAFPHPTHVEDLGMDCTFCHRNVTEGAAATIPSAGLCLTCHQVVGDDLPEIEKLREMVVENERPIDWVRVHRVPDHVHFVHEAHIRFFSERDGIAETAVCATCHGDVGSMEKVEQVRALKMGDCVNCHRDNGAPTDCTTCHY